MSLRISCYLLLTFLPILLYAQLDCPPVGKERHSEKISLTIGVGPTLLYGDIKKEYNLGLATVFKADYKLYKGLYAGVEGQWGILNSYGKYYNRTDLEVDYQNVDPRFVRNYYIAGTWNLTVYPALFFYDEYRDFKKPSLQTLIVRGLYGAIGFGGIINQYDKLYRHDPNNPNNNAEFERNVDGEIEKYKTPTKDLLFPVFNIGVSLPINKYSYTSRGFWSVVVNGQFNFSEGDQLDAYQPITGDGVSSKADVFSFGYLGLKYTF
ncbi:hypothetical protein [Sphingobacterium sp. LRF_L2]|uniref:hypothetical protein n=1 Tax=Sphingobacterium sp. LRF_L2 TaxID=3369421 RepID=UPI003F635010